MTPTQALRAADRELDQAEQWVSISRYALIYGVSRRTVHKWLRAQLLETYRVGWLVRVRNQPPRCA